MSSLPKDSLTPSSLRLRARNTRSFFLATACTVMVFICITYLFYDAKRSTLFSTNFLSSHLGRMRKGYFATLSRVLVPSPPDSPHPMILLWTPFFSTKDKWMPLPSTLQCPISDCNVTDDRRFLNKSAAVVFHWRNANVSDLPTERFPNQRWVLFNLEAPPHTPADVLEILASRINWTVTFRKDSDIHAPYGWIVKKNLSTEAPKPHPGRRPVCWIVSHCNTTSKREEFVKILKRHIPVDVYGACGDYLCPTADKLGCYQALSKNCKFYLSFENSICKDYVTEKLFNAMSTDMVPVVMGGGDYRNILPPNSYIDALRFGSPEQLAEYLQMLDKDDEKYLSYLAWKKDYEVVQDLMNWTCELCRKLHTADANTHDDLYSWWYDTSRCSSWHDALYNSSFSVRVR